MGIPHPELLQGGDKWPPLLSCRRQKALVISISAAYRAASGRLRTSQEGAVRLTAGTASSEGVHGAGGASFRLTHETVGKRPQFSSKTADGSRAAGLPRLLRGTGAQPSEPQPRCFHNLISGDVAPVLQTAVGHTDPAWSSKGRAAEEGNQEVRSLGPSGRLVLHHLPILQVSKLRLREVHDVLKVTQCVSDRAQDLNSKLNFLISRISQVLST